MSGTCRVDRAEPDYSDRHLTTAGRLSESAMQDRHPSLSRGFVPAS
jgi:hypothetical protein